MLISYLAYSLNWKAEEIYSSEKMLEFHQTTWHYIPEDGTTHCHCYEKLKSNIQAGVCEMWSSVRDF
jgi:hypothetical protein